MMPVPPINGCVLSGAWDDNVSWEFYLADELPDPLLCTAVYCLALLPQTDEVVLTRNHRGWEMLGGHIEPGETIRQALLRECLEEGGFTPQAYRLFGCRKLISKRRVPHAQRGGYYPFPISYIPHFVATSALPLQKPSGIDILQARAVPVGELNAMLAEHYPLAVLGLDWYRAGRIADSTVE